MKARVGSAHANANVRGKGRAQPHARTRKAEPLSDPFVWDAVQSVLADNNISLGPIGLTDEEQEVLYGHAVACYGKEQYTDAMCAFVLLMREGPAEARYYKGTAACYQMTKEFGKAAAFYGFTYLLKHDDPAPLCHVGQCLLAEDQPGEALEAYQLFLSESEGNPYCMDLRQHAQSMIAALTAETEVAV